MNTVKVQSIESLKYLRAGLVRFGETAQTVLSDADGELQRALNWLETEAVSRWQGEIRKRQDALTKAKDALRAKKLFHADGFKPTVVDEEKAVRLAMARLEEAERKLTTVKRHGMLLHKEVMQYKGQVQRFGNTVAIDIPIAVARLEGLVRQLELYLGLKPLEAAPEGVVGERSGSARVAEEGLGSMARPADEDPQTRGYGDPGTEGRKSAEAGEEGSHGGL